VRRHLAATEPDLARDWGWRARVDAALAAGDSGGAARMAEAAAAAMPDTARRVQAWARAGAIHASAGRNTAAAAAFRNAIDESVASPAAVEAARLLATLPERDAGGPAAASAASTCATATSTARRPAYDAYLASGRADAAERARIQLDIGRALFDARDYAAAERRLRLAVSAGGSTRDGRRTRRCCWAARCTGRAAPPDARAAFVRATQGLRRHHGRGARALPHCRHRPRRRPHREREDALPRRDRGDRSRRGAIRVAARHVRAAWRVGRREAAAVFRQAYSGATGNTRQQPGYWWAHSLEKAGARDSARVIFDEVRRIDPFSFYGLRAGERVGAGLWDFMQSRPATVPAAVRREVAGRLDALDVLRGAALDESATFEAARLVDRFGAIEGALYALGDAYHAREQTFSGIRIGRELLRREGAWNRSLLELVYPFPYRDAVMREARANNVDPYLMAGLIRQESMFNTRARSPVGALGLMQVMPRTGTTVARSAGYRELPDGTPDRTGHQPAHRRALPRGPDPQPQRAHGRCHRVVQRRAEPPRRMAALPGVRGPGAVHRADPVPGDAGLREDRAGERAHLPRAVRHAASLTRRRIDATRSYGRDVAAQDSGARRKPNAH
jgi:tetratricopeptide (TPR) repeat protein